jgi:hypothetical protein
MNVRLARTPTVRTWLRNVTSGVYSVEKLLGEKQTRMRVACFSFLQVSQSIPRVARTPNFSEMVNAKTSHEPSDPDRLSARQRTGF